VNPQPTEPPAVVELRSLLSAALDEIFVLRQAMAYEARVVEAHYEALKSFPKSRRKIAEEQVVRMRTAVHGASKAYAGTNSESRRQIARACGFDTLTMYQWINEVGERSAVRVVAGTPRKDQT
jgi:DNA invertase Pin-like site-specific DNA recombinase